MSVAYLVLASAAAATAAKPADDLAIQAVHNFGACIVREAPTGAAEELLAMDFHSAEYREKLRAMARGHDRCITPGWQLGSSELLVAGAMAEALLKSEVKPDEMPQRLSYNPARQVIKAQSPTETMALCTALNAPQATARLLSQTIGPVLGQCLKKDLELNKPALRSLLALAAWRIVMTPTAAVQ